MAAPDTRVARQAQERVTVSFPFSDDPVARVATRRGSHVLAHRRPLCDGRGLNFTLNTTASHRVHSCPSSKQNRLKSKLPDSLHRHNSLQHHRKQNRYCRAVTAKRGRVVSRERDEGHMHLGSDMHRDARSSAPVDRVAGPAGSLQPTTSLSV